MQNTAVVVAVLGLCLIACSSSSPSSFDGSPDATAASTCALTGETGGPEIDAVLAPLPFQVIQRNLDGRGTLAIGVTSNRETDCIEARIVDSDNTIAGDWHKLTAQEHGASLVSGVLPAIAVGEFAIDVRVGFRGVAGQVRRIEPVSVGDVFLIAGQSNASFSGEQPLATTTMKVSYFDGQQWLSCQDPVLSVDPQGSGGAAWCPLGDQLFEANETPIGFAPMAWGGSSLAQWQQGSASSPVAPGALYQRLIDTAAHFGPSGAKALLWHQGESELTEGTSVADHETMLGALIDGSRTAAGFELPWLVSEVSYLADTETLAPFLCPGLTLPECEDKIIVERARVIAGQRAVIDPDNLIFLGVSTDFLGPDDRHDGSHFDLEALYVVAELWHERLRAIFPDIN